MRGNRVSVPSSLSLSLCISAYYIMRFRDLAGYTREIRAEKYHSQDEESLHGWSKTFSTLIHAVTILVKGRKEGTIRRVV